MSDTPNTSILDGPIIKYKEVTTPSGRKIVRLGKVQNMKGVWYKITIFECPVCGKCEEIRERMPAFPPPSSMAERRKIVAHYCGCLG